MRILIFLLLLGLSPSMAWALSVTITTAIEGGDKPVVVGKTNLPDGTVLMVSVSRKESSYMAQDKTSVSGGTFRAGPFSQSGSPLNPGVYTLDISTPLASVQPPAVGAVFGQGGSKLEGPLAKKTPYGSKVVEYRKTFKLGGGVGSGEKDRAAQQQAKKDTHEWWIRSCKDNCNLTKNYAAKRSEQFNWDQCYARCLAEEPKK